MFNVIPSLFPRAFHLFLLLLSKYPGFPSFPGFESTGQQVLNSGRANKTQLRHSDGVTSLRLPDVALEDFRKGACGLLEDANTVSLR